MRFASGLPISGQRVPVYDGEEDVADIRKMDFSEIEDEIEVLHERINRAKAAREEAAKNKAKAADEAKFNAEVEARLKAAAEKQDRKGLENAPQELSTNNP